MASMSPEEWSGVFPAITTPFTIDGAVDHIFLAHHVERLLEAGSGAIVPLGSLGEGATLSFEEKIAVLRTLLQTIRGRVPLIPGIASLATSEAVALAREAEQLGCGGLMVLPPYVYRSDWHEMRTHLDAVIHATSLPCMLYNNPGAYGTDFSPEQIAEMAIRHDNLAAVKESSGDVRRVTAIKALLGERLAVFVGLDDMIVEGVRAGADGWVAGLVNALPVESMRLFEAAISGRDAEADAIYRWFLPLLRLDTVPKFVQLIKLIQQEVGLGSYRVRPPRLPLEDHERELALELIRESLANREEVFG